MALTQQELGNLPPIEYLANLPQTPEYGKLCLVRFHRGQRHFKKLFVIGNMEVRDDRLSPDGQFYYMVAVNNGTFVGKISQVKFQKLSEGLYRCLFSPNSRYLLGNDLSNYSMRLFDYRQDKQWELTKEACAPYFGWYPNNRHVWYIVESSQGYYRQDVQTGQRWKLSPPEIRRLHTDWELLNPRYRFWHPSLQGWKAYAYSPDSWVRVRVEPYDFYPPAEHAPPGSHQLFLEWKSGGSKLLLRRGDHSWVEVFPQDVSVDGRWVLIVCSRWRKQIAEGESHLQYDLVVLEVKTQKLFYPFHGKQDAGVGAPGPLRQAYWFGKE